MRALCVMPFFVMNMHGCEPAVFIIGAAFMSDAPTQYGELLTSAGLMHHDNNSKCVT